MWKASPPAPARFPKGAITDWAEVKPWGKHDFRGCGKTTNAGVTVEEGPSGGHLKGSVRPQNR